MVHLTSQTQTAPLTDETPDAAAAAAATASQHDIEQAETNARVAQATGVLALGNIASRVLGLAREVALTNLFGASSAVDALRVAITVPIAFYDLLIGGHVNGAIIPVLSEVVAKHGRRALWELVSVLVSLVTVVLTALVLALVLFAPQIVPLAGGAGFDAPTSALAAALLRLTAPALLFMSLFAVVSGTLVALRSFNYPAFAGALFNGSIVLVTLLFAPAPQLVVTLGSGTVTWGQLRPMSGITAAAAGWLIGALAQLVLQIVGLRGARVRLTLRWRHPAIGQIARLYTPVMFSLIIDTLVIRFFSYNLASSLAGEGNIAYMTWATTLIQFPQGLVATAISIAILPTLARQAALFAPARLLTPAAKEKEHESQHATGEMHLPVPADPQRAFKDTLGLGLRLVTTLIVPAAVGLFVLATPIVALLFEHGAFNSHDTAVTALALRLYLVGLPFAALDLLLVYAFYARQDTLTPALIGVVSLVVYMIVAVMLAPTWGLFSLMAADSVKHIVHAALSAYLLHRRLGGLGGQRLVVTLGKTALAALAMGAAAALVEPGLERWFWSGAFVHELLLVLSSGAVALGVFALCAALLRIEEWRWLGGLLRRRLGRDR